VWFDEDELPKFDEPHEFKTHSILKLAQEKRAVKIDPEHVKKCPRCPDERLVKQFFDIENMLQIDQCWNCGGIWLDPGELNAVRAQFDTYEERAQAVNEYIDARLINLEAKMEAATKTQIDATEKTEPLIPAKLPS